MDNSEDFWMFFRRTRLMEKIDLCIACITYILNHPNMSDEEKIGKIEMANDLKISYETRLN